MKFFHHLIIKICTYLNERQAERLRLEEKKAQPQPIRQFWQLLILSNQRRAVVFRGSVKPAAWVCNMSAQQVHRALQEGSIYVYDKPEPKQSDKPKQSGWEY